MYFNKFFFCCCFFNNFFFYFNFFFTTIRKYNKSNNKKNNYINQLLRLPLLKYTHTHTQRKNIYILNEINKKESSTNLSPQGKSTPTTPQTEVTVKE